MSHASPPLVPGRENLRGIILMSLAVLCFAVLDALSKYLSRYYPVSFVVWARYAVHVVLMVALFGPRMGFGLMRTGRPALQVLRAVCLLATSLLFVSGLRYLPLAEATSIIFLTPLIVTALSMPLLGERVDRRDWLAVSVGFVGVLIIVRPGGALLTAATLLPFAAAVCNSLYQIMTRKFRGAESPPTMNFITGLVGAVLMSPALPLSWETPTFGHLPLLIGMGVAAVSGHFLLIKAFECASPAVLGPFGYGQLLWATLLGYSVFGALPDTGSIAGMAVIVASGLYITYHHFLERRRRR